MSHVIQRFLDRFTLGQIAHSRILMYLAHKYYELTGNEYHDMLYYL